jgi:hypothetical protein
MARITSSRAGRSIRRWPGLATLLGALALTASQPAESRAQRVDDAAVGARYQAARVAATPTGLSGVLRDTTRATSAQRPIRPYLLVGALAGAVIGVALAESFHDSFCDEPAPGYSCSTTGAAEAAAIGAGLGLMVGAVVWVLTRSRGSPPRTAG